MLIAVIVCSWNRVKSLRFFESITDKYILAWVLGILCICNPICKSLSSENRRVYKRSFQTGCGDIDKVNYKVCILTFYLFIYFSLQHIPNRCSIKYVYSVEMLKNCVQFYFFNHIFVADFCRMLLCEARYTVCLSFSLVNCFIRNASCLVYFIVSF